MNGFIRLVILLAFLSLAGCWTTTANTDPHRESVVAAEDAIPFEVFAGFKRMQEVNPIFACVC